MKQMKFTYLREGAFKEYEVLMLKDMGTAIEGLSIKGLPKEEVEKIVEIQRQYEEALAPYMKYYRKFLKNLIR